MVNDYRRESILYQPSDTHCRKDYRKLRIPNHFTNWQKDTRESLNKHADSDVECWKVRHFIDDKNEVGYINEILKENYAFLKDLYMTAAAQSRFPMISLMDATNFLK